MNKRDCFHFVHLIGVDRQLLTCSLTVFSIDQRQSAENGKTPLLFTVICFRRSKKQQQQTNSRIKRRRFSHRHRSLTSELKTKQRNHLSGLNFSFVSLL